MQFGDYKRGSVKPSRPSAVLPSHGLIRHTCSLLVILLMTMMNINTIHGVCLEFECVIDQSVLKSCEAACINLYVARAHACDTMWSKQSIQALNFREICCDGRCGSC